ncbi:MAG: hypothetical protein HY717_16335 [Planctomycetes bacterium]|nr:hypothetical protein [Planctomycetota bacterium]
MKTTKSLTPADPSVRKVIRSFTATLRDLEMLEAISHYHGFSKSATITSLVRKEFWRIFPRGTGGIRPDPGARVVGMEVTHEDDH